MYDGSISHTNLPHSNIQSTYNQGLTLVSAVCRLYLSILQLVCATTPSHASDYNTFDTKLASASLSTSHLSLTSFSPILSITHSLSLTGRRSGVIYFWLVGCGKLDLCLPSLALYISGLHSPLSVHHLSI